MIKEQEGKKLALFFSLACQDGNLHALIDAYTKCEQIDRSYLETLHPLHSAVRSESLPAVQFLLDKGFDVNSRNNSRQTPMFLAASSGQVDIVKVLIQAGADADLADSRGWTPLMVAVKNNNASLTRILVREGKANPKAQDKYGKTAFDKVSSMDILNALRSLDEEEAALRSYAKPKEESNANEIRNNEMFVLRDLVNQELDNLSKEEYGAISGKLKEKFLQHSRNLGLDVSEKAFRKVLTDLDAKLAGYKPLLIEETTKNFNQKYRKFVKEIEKYLNLKLNIAIAAHNSDKSLCLNDTTMNHSFSEDMFLKGFLSPTGNNKILSSSAHEAQNRTYFEQQALNEYASPNRAMKPLLSPSSHIPQENDGLRAYMKSPEALNNSRRNTPLCRRSAKNLENSHHSVYESASKSPQRKRNMSEEKVALFKKKDDSQKVYQLMVNQTDKMVDVITEKSEVALDKIFDSKLALLKETIDRDLQEKFKAMIGFVKGMIEEKIVTSIRENVRPSRLNTMRGEKKKTEDKGTSTTTEQFISKPLSEIRSTPVKSSTGGNRNRSSSNERNLSPSYKQQREEFIRKKLELRMSEQSLSPQREIEGPPRQEIQPKVMRTINKQGQGERKSTKKVDQENRQPARASAKSQKATNKTPTPTRTVTRPPHSILNNHHKNAFLTAQNIVQNTSQEIEKPVRDNNTDTKGLASQYQYSIQRQTKNGVAFSVRFKNNQNIHEIFPIASEGSSECITESNRLAGQSQQQVESNLTPSDQILKSNYSFQPQESNNQQSYEGENDEDSLEFEKVLEENPREIEEKEYQLNCLKSTLERASYFDNSYSSSRNSFSTKGAAAETAETKETRESNKGPSPVWKIANYERKNMKV